ncbi:MAG: T9SS type A sorting domain-containing protein [bacterium]
MKTKITLLVALGLSVSLSQAQFQKTLIDPATASAHQLPIHPFHSSILTQPLSGEVQPGQVFPVWNRQLISFEKKHLLPEAEMQEKAAKTKRKLEHLQSDYPDESALKGIADNPTIGASFEANWFDETTPPDNSMAISAGGLIVSVTNSHIEYYNTSGTLLFTSSFDDFFNDPSFTALIYDPVVLYDSQADRFFMVVLHGSNSSVSTVITCFSKSNNPSDGWWVYKLSGNPLGNACWFDYPKIGVSNNEVYVTGNLFTDNDVFSQVVLYQIPKAPGFAGGSLNYSYWYNITESPFTLVPVSYGQQGNYGPGIYLVCTAPNNVGDDHIRLYDLTDDLSGNPQLNVSSISTSFQLAGDAPQLGTDILLDNGDNRALAGFWLDGIIHFVFHSEYTNNYNGLNYNRLTVSNHSLWNTTFGLDGYDYSYPNVASFGNSETDKSVMIGFDRVGSDIYPQFRVVYCDDAGNWSASTLIKEGTDYVDVYQSQGVARWGDYTGISRKHNASKPEVWMSGCFGTFRLDEHAFDSWIAQINGVSIGIPESEATKTTSVKLFPNPVTDRINVEFELSDRSEVEITVLDLHGRVVKLLLRDTAPAGKHCFSFNKGALQPGSYFIRVKTANHQTDHEKFIVE